jgi:hypothetical protein
MHGAPAASRSFKWLSPCMQRRTHSPAPPTGGTNLRVSPPWYDGTGGSCCCGNHRGTINAHMHVTTDRSSYDLPCASTIHAARRLRLFQHARRVWLTRAVADEGHSSCEGSLAGDIDYRVCAKFPLAVAISIGALAGAPSKRLARNVPKLTWKNFVKCCCRHL